VASNGQGQHWIIGTGGHSMKHSALALVIGLASLGLASGANAASLIDFQGYSYESGGFPPSNVGDALNFVALVDGLTPPLSWNPAGNEYTLHLTSLTSTGTQQPDPNNIVVNYLGGTLAIHEDSSFNSNPAVNPPNASVPSSYTDGPLYLGGTLTNFTIFFNTQFNSGAFEADVTFSNGGHFSELGAQTTGYTFGGVFIFGTPQGYDLQWDGQVLLDPVPVENVTWGAVKNLFANR
jgi:hypothetical protein